MTVEEELKAEYGNDFEERIHMWLGSHLSPELPDRYKRLCREVVFRLPSEWDSEVEWSVDTDREPSPGGYANVLREEEAADLITPCEITLYPALMDRLSDAACRWVIAHEFAHAASGIPCGSITIDGKPHTRVKGTVDLYEQVPAKKVHEDAADRIAMDWGFTSELPAFLIDDARQEAT
jgi:hypothetical protein